MSLFNSLLNDVAGYYSAKISEHGVSAKGVDWNSEATQELRFDILMQLIKDEGDFAILDYGCGYGALLNHLQKKFAHFSYTGFDISKEMLESAQLSNTGKKVEWIALLNDQMYDYTLASGIFNVKLDHHESEWKNYIEETLIEINSKSKKGFAFNMLTAYSDQELMRDNLYYANPSYYFDFCKKHFSKYVSVLHDYPLYEFTVLVKKEV